MLARNVAEIPLRFLLVEDDPAHAELVRRGLEDQGDPHHLIHLSDGEAALDYLFRRGFYADAEKSPRPHLVLLDLRLPRKSGFDVLEEVKAVPDLRDIPIVILSTSKQKKDVVRAYSLHANSFVVKPGTFNEFSALIGRLTRYWLGWNYRCSPARSEEAAVR